MKKFLFLIAALAGSFTMNAQGIDLGVKAGANFSNFQGDINSDGITSFHAGLALELNLVPMFSVQAEGLFSSQGAKYDNAFGAAEDINLDYISVPVLAKFYVVPGKLSLMAGPQFSFLVNDAKDAFETKSFDLAASGGVELKIIMGLFAQARYNIGLNNVNDSGDADIKNGVFQLSVGYYF
ncbi:outer membrane beta-barrel protein [Flavobacterium rakeshii]|uniref:Outer membrane beta-barrel protein n=1 Tax=Flavobacterium rakeshii TaxID=1038845 RepID=A0A6N8H9H4_9FLAO|nr:porin family protein [Flavobacterium rakeshii]MUV03214.1 outer membrane beta-barrel protein [Flavobacterium rakeshii]